jgi:hypothetical protein
MSVRGRFGLLALISALLLPPPLRSDEAKDRDELVKRLTGVWYECSREWDGRAHRSVPDAWIELSENRFKFSEATLVSGLEEKGEFSIRKLGKDSFEVDVTATRNLSTDLRHNNPVDFIRKELWRFTETGELQRAFPISMNAKFRPAALETKPGDDICVSKFLRMDDPRFLIRGEWRIETEERDGVAQPAARRGGHTHTLKVWSEGFRRTFGIPSKSSEDEKGVYEVVEVKKGVLKVDVTYTRTSSPVEGKEPTKTEHKAKELWELVEGTTLKICRGAGDARPEEMKTKEGDGRTVWVFKREKRE